MKRFNWICLVLSLFLLTSPISVFADEPAFTEITISNTEQFLEFADSCRLDSYSHSLSVTLTADIDLTGQAFSGIPVFCGSFDGNSHSITGVTLDYSGSNTGLFRYLTATAKVSDLNVIGTFSPKGSASCVGGIAGSNAGTITNCTFSGTVSGIDNIGGIAGINTATGIIRACSSQGNVFGNHFTGGIAGNNSGIIQSCQNSGAVNTQLKQNNVSLSDITIESLTGTESAATVTDIGGIAGISSGHITDCVNEADIGYKSIGYNIGGITGCQTGYIADCINTGTISGRKEVGGIVGQLEPVLAITYATDTLQILQQQLNTLSSQIERTAGNITNTISRVKKEFLLIRGEITQASDAIQTLLPGDGSVPDAERFAQVIQSLENSLYAINQNFVNIYQALENADNTLSGNMASISSSIGAMQDTLNSASDHLGGSILDHSDSDTDDDLTAKIAHCQNSGTVNADLNGGGIAGSIAFESDLDPEADIDIFGDATLNFSGAYRAVITDCDNFASVTVKKQYAGGIVGYATLGLVRSCNNIANLICPSASYVGGIAGRSNGQIRSCNTKNILSAQKLAGGIAGQASTVSDCLSLTQVMANEKAGCILGYTEDVTNISNNRYLQITLDAGAIDGISYDAAAQPVSVDDFLAIDELPDFFHTYKMTFVFSDQTTQEITLKTGEVLTAQHIPELPLLDGCKGRWNGLDSISFFDATVNCTYESKLQVVQSQTLRDNGLPILLAEGAFRPDFLLELSPIQDSLVPDVLEAWSFTNSGAATIRYLPPDNHFASSLSVMVQTADGSWKQISHTVNGRYLVFTTDADTFCVVPAQNTPWGLYIAAATAFLVAMGIVFVILIRRKRAVKQSAKPVAEP